MDCRALGRQRRAQQLAKDDCTPAGRDDGVEAAQAGPGPLDAA